MTVIISISYHMSFTVIRLIKMGRLGHVVCIMAMRIVYKILV